jgi:hypothetical protein
MSRRALLLATAVNRRHERTNSHQEHLRAHQNRNVASFRSITVNDGRSADVHERQHLGSMASRHDPFRDRLEMAVLEAGVRERLARPIDAFGGERTGGIEPIQ